MALRPKVARVIKLKAFKRAFYRTNPFKLNEKDRRQLRSFIASFDKLFIDF